MNPKQSGKPKHPKVENIHPSTPSTPSPVVHFPFWSSKKNVQDLGSDLKEVTLSFSEEQEDALRLYGLAGGLRPKHFFPSFLWRKIWFLVENSWIQSRIYDIYI